MKFVIDEDIPRSTGEFLQTLGHTVFDIRGTLMIVSPKGIRLRRK
jgi:hypothetical protein